MEIPAVFDPTAFDFRAYERQLADIDIEQQAPKALSGILMLQTETGASRTYQEIREESEQFFSNPVIAEIEGLQTRLAMQYAQFAHACGGHDHTASGQLTAGSMGNVYTLGASAIEQLANGSGESHNHIHEDDEDDNEGAARIRRLGRTAAARR